MRQRVVHDQVAGAEEMADRRLVRGVSTDKRDRRLCSDKGRQLPFQFPVHRLFARHQTTCRNTRAVSLDRLLRGAVDRGIPRHSKVVVAGKADHRTAADDCRVSRSRFMHAEIGIRHAGGRQHLHRLLQPLVFGEFGEAIVAWRNLPSLQFLDWHVEFPTPFRFGPHVFGDGLSHLAHCLDLRQNLLGKPPAERLLQSMRDLQTFQRIESQVDGDIAVEIQRLGSLLGDRPHVVHHQFGHLRIDVAGGSRLGSFRVTFRCGFLDGRLLRSLPPDPLLNHL